MDGLIDKCLSAFRSEYGSDPEVIAQAPGRVNLIGDHTDYTGGFAMPCAIGRQTIVAAGRSPNRHNLRSTIHSSTISFPSEKDPIPRGNNWSDYVRGVFQGFADRGFPVPAVNLLVHSNVPTGSGLSSSAALEAATALAIDKLVSADLDCETLVRLCHKAEHEYAAVPCGFLDQFSVINARQDHLMLFDSRALSAEQVGASLQDHAMLVLDSGVKHSLGDSAYEERVKECRQIERILDQPLRDSSLNDVNDKLDGVLLRRARHVVSENQRVCSMRDALREGDLNTAGELMFESHRSLADDYEVSCEETDLIVELLKNKGVTGARMTGGGFGGSVVALVAHKDVDDIVADLARQYLASTGIALNSLLVRTAGGASIIET